MFKILERRNEAEEGYIKYKKVVLQLKCIHFRVVNIVDSTHNKDQRWTNQINGTDRTLGH